MEIQQFVQVEVSQIQDLENEIQESGAVINGLAQSLQDLEQDYEKQRTAIRDAVDSLKVLDEVPLCDLDVAIDSLIELLGRAL